MFMQPGKINVQALPLEEIKEKPPQANPLNIVNIKKGPNFKKQVTEMVSTPKALGGTMKRREKLPSLKNNETPQLPNTQYSVNDDQLSVGTITYESGPNMQPSR